MDLVCYSKPISQVTTLLADDIVMKDVQAPEQLGRGGYGAVFRVGRIARKIIPLIHYKDW